MSRAIICADIGFAVTALVDLAAGKTELVAGKALLCVIALAVAAYLNELKLSSPPRKDR